ncbi:MAG: hypothetical protein JWO19_1919 [Bryobacterales bacterium]|nr:hypothetical protein [Bryobacterales bacterium]
MKVALALMFYSMLCCAQDGGVFVNAVEPQENRIQGARLEPATITPKSAFVGTTDQVFPHIAMGNSWETVIVILNMSNSVMNFTMRFYAEDGSPMAVTFKDYPQSNITTTTAAAGQLPPGTSFNFALFSVTPDLRVGWATLQYDSSLGRLGGYAIFRQSVPGRPTFESLVPLSAFDDYKFYLPFDNIQGFITAIALVNPASNVSSRITITATDLNGNFIDRIFINLPPNGHLAFALTDRMPALSNRLGTLYVESDSNRLSAMGIRFNGAAFSSIPIMNWAGMFP